MRKKIIAMLLVVFLMTVLAGCGGGAGAETPSGDPGSDPGTESPGTEPAARVGVIFPGSIRDGGWNEDSFAHLQAAADTYNVEYSYQESVAPGEAADVMRNFAYDGYDLIIANDINYGDIAKEVAEEFPDIQFVVTAAYVSGDNLASISTTNWENTYLAGVLAGLVTETDNIGILTATDSEVARKMRQGFANGAKSVNPGVTIQTAFTGSWDDIVKGKELIGSMITQGADVIYSQSGNVNAGAVEAAQEAGIKAIGAIVDMTDLAPDTVVASAIASPGALIDYMIGQYIDGTIEGKVYIVGVKDGAEGLVFNPAFEAELAGEVMDTLADVEAKFAAGEIEEPVAE